jgi:anti-sigma factor RsiW
MRCSDVERLLPQYADDALPASQSEGIAGHLVDCAACRGELAQLQRSLDALNLAAREPAPDLWALFQNRLTQSSAAACCRDIEALLPKFADGELARAQTLQVRDHLAECAACTAREAIHSRPFRALDQAGKAPPAVELWPAFTLRLGKSISCKEAEALLPAMLAGASATQTLPLQSHLHACRSCAASLAAYETSLSALSRVGHAMPEVDLWPAFTARLAQEAAPRRAQTARSAGWLPALASWLRGPLLQPALGFAAFALITVAGQLLSQSISSRLRGPELVQLARSSGGEIVAAQPTVASAESEMIPAPVSVESVRKPAPVQVAPTLTPSTNSPSVPLPITKSAIEPKENSELEQPGRRRAPGLRVAFNLPSTGGELIPVPDNAFNPDLGGSSIVDERDGMKAVVQAVELLAGSEDALNSPFDSNANDK